MARKRGADDRGAATMGSYRKDTQVGHIVESRPCCTCHFCSAVKAGPHMLSQSSLNSTPNDYRVTPFQFSALLGCKKILTVFIEG